MSIGTETERDELLAKVTRLRLVLWFRQLVVSPPDDSEVCHLERVALLAAALQSTRHTVAHVEVARAHVRRQV